MRVAIIGLGMGGATLALLLHDAGHDVTVVEQEADPRPVGAGIWLQMMGQQVLDRIGLLDDVRAASRTVSSIDIRTAGGRPLIAVGYDDVPGTLPALGVHRGALFMLLHEAVRARGIEVRLDVPVTGARPVSGGIAVETTSGDLGAFDLVVGCDGSRSRVRRSMNVTVRDRPYAYGAHWAIVPDPDELASDTLFQSLRGTREYFGVLPTGRGRSSIFWSALHPTTSHDVADWRRRAEPLAGRFAPLLERVEELLPATYRDVVVSAPYRLDGQAGAVLVGDAAHAMSPQLGTGTSLALADAWSLHHALSAHPDLERALPAHAAARAAHVRWYAWCTRMMMPVFQSDLTPLAWPRDALAPWVTRVPGVRGQMVSMLAGDRVSPWGRWRLPG